MKERIADLWTIPADARVVTTNGVTTKRGAAVMGRGCALEAKERYPGIEMELGTLLERGGNHVYLIRTKTFLDAAILSFPVKEIWSDPAKLDLIERSVKELVALADQYPEWKTIVMGRAGCGSGRLTWSQVQPLMRGLDDRFVCVTK